MPTSLLGLFVTLRSILRSRVDLQLENLAPGPSNRRAATLGEATETNLHRSHSLGFSIALLARLDPIPQFKATAKLGEFLSSLPTD